MGLLIQPGCVLYPRLFSSLILVGLPHTHYSIVVVSELVDSNEKHVTAEILADTSVLVLLFLIYRLGVIHTMYNFFISEKTQFSIIYDFKYRVFLAFQNSSIGDLVTDSLRTLLLD